MCDFEQRIDVVKVDLPEPEDLDLFWVQGEEIGRCLTRTKQQGVVILIHLIPALLEHSLTYFIPRGIAAIVIRISGLLFHLSEKLEKVSGHSRTT